MCQRVVGGNNYIFSDIYKWRTTEILSRILAIFVHFCEILNIRDKNETCSFLTIFTFTSQLLVKLKFIQCGQYDTNVTYWKHCYMWNVTVWWCDIKTVRFLRNSFITSREYIYFIKLLSFGSAKYKIIKLQVNFVQFIALFTDIKQTYYLVA